MNTAATLVARSTARTTARRTSSLLDRLALRLGVALVAWSRRDRRLPLTHDDVTALRRERADLQERERRHRLVGIRR